MNEPTDRELQALVAEARREHGVAEREMPASDARPWFESAFGLAARVYWTYANQAWGPLRSALLHIALFALRAAWEAGRRMGAQPDPLGKCGAPGPGGVTCSRLAGHWAPDDPYRYHEGGGYRWSDSGMPLPKEPTPSPPSTDVDALLAEADALVSAEPNMGIMVRLARALRAERERASFAREEAEEAGRAYARNLSQRMKTRKHLRAVLAHGWPDGTTGPAVVRAARAFLAGAEDAAPAASEVAPARGECPETLELRDRLKEVARSAGAFEGDGELLAEVAAAHVASWLRAAREETRKALAAQNQAEAERDDARSRLKEFCAEYEKLAERLDGVEEALARMAALMPAKGEA